MVQKDPELADDSIDSSLFRDSYHPINTHHRNGTPRALPREPPPSQTDDIIRDDERRSLLEQPEVTVVTSRFVKFLLLLVFCLIRLEVGFLCTLTGPILVDLQYQTNTTTTELSSIFFTRAIGFIAGSVLSVYVFKTHLVAIMLVFILMVGGSLVLIPMSYNIYTLAAAYLIQTMGFNIFRTSSPALLFIITHGDDRGPALQLVTMAFIIGGTLSPPIAAPFVTSKDHGNGTHHGGGGNWTYGNDDAPVVTMAPITPSDDGWLRWDSDNKLLPLFIGTFAYTLAISIATILICRLCDLDFSRQPEKTSDKQPKLSKTIFVFTICTILMLLGGAAFTTAFNFTTFYVIKTMLLSPGEGILANSIFSVTVAIMAVLGIFTIKYFGYLRNLYAICFFMIISPPILWIAAESLIVVCMGLASLGIATSFLFAPIFMWGAEQVTQLTSLSAWIQNGFTLAEISFPFLVGVTLDLSEHAFLFWMTGLCVFFALTFLLGEMCVKCWRNENEVISDYSFNER